MNATLRFRKEMNGPESHLVNRFLESKNALLDCSLQYEVLIETYAEAGVPDILIIGWDKRSFKHWHPTRSKLNKQEIKVLHHISTFKKRGTLVHRIAKQLGIVKKRLAKILSALEESDLIYIIEERVRVKDLMSNFFVRKIISIEAKIKNWKSAYSQAQINLNFASHSYVLLPEDQVSERVRSKFDSTIGLIALAGDRPILKKRARKGALPSSYYSWLINEHIGRQHFCT